MGFDAIWITPVVASKHSTTPDDNFMVALHRLSVLTLTKTPRVATMVTGPRTSTRSTRTTAPPRSSRASSMRHMRRCVAVVEYTKLNP
jgi:hypothetical protein